MRILVAVLATALLLVAAPSACAAPTGESLSAPGWTWARQAAPLDLGVTHMQYSLAPSDPAAARERGAAILRGAGRWQNQHLMGFGALNPEPGPGTYDWASLDTRMDLIRTTGGSTVLTLAGAPDWMKGGRPGESDFSRIDEAPLPQHYDDFAALAAVAVARYPQVRAVQVWNELKGFYDDARNDWDAAAYTDLYDRVYRAVKRVRPDVAVGGPYMPLDTFSSPTAGGTPSDVTGPWGVADRRSLTVVEYWLARSVGADFLVVDGGTATKDAGLVTDPSGATAKFAALTAWLRARSTLPVWWAEFYPETASGPGGHGFGPTDGSGTDDDAASPARAAATLDAVAAMAGTGVSVALLWQPQASASFPYAALWTDTADGTGGRPTALTAPWTWLVPRLAGGGIEVGRSPDGRVLALRAGDGTLLVNVSGDELVVDDVTLAAHGTAIVPRP